MRFLHTSDWHLGRSLHRADLREAQAAFLGHLVETVRSERVDAVLVAGDVYDRAIPPLDAVALYDDALIRLREAGARVILISGNHDSASRLGVNSALIDASGVHLRTRAAGLAEPVMLRDADGDVAVYGVPYLEPALGLPDAAARTATVSARKPAPRSGELGPRGGELGPRGGELGPRGGQLGPPGGQPAPRVGGLEPRGGQPLTHAADPAAGGPAPDVAAAADPAAGRRSHASVLGAALGRIRADAAARGAARTVVLAHAWVAGGRDDAERAEAAKAQASDSERDISVGGIGYVPAGLFDGFSYAALGHLHGRQTLASHLRYAGSPLPYSFSEKDHQKGTWLVDVGADGTAAAEWIPAPVYRRLATLTGRLEDLLAAREHDRHTGDFLAVTLTDPVRPEGAMDRLRRRFPHILTLEFKPDGVPAGRRSYGEKVRGRDDLAVAAEFVRHVRNTGASEPERELLGAAFAAVRLAHDDGGR